ncbi:hypothetical protein [Laribacter hongkongensis]|uniref:hypothetical protein n=1 Tax=Laribacter hongkongensis TaxID=168471 RepID=UPI001EFC7BEE|nr:hypothetical protein [Laribacter hongkongensis]MCG9080356.1 hypothetical protein [Laribacter hongkongensis]
MARIALVGNKYGRLTVIEDSLGTQVACRCDCGTEALYPRLISKPSYRHSRMCKDCLAHPCEVCGKLVYKSNKATCSIECHRERNRQREKQRYERVRHTDGWKKVRADYLARLKTRMDADPEFKARHVEARRLAVRKHFLMLRKDADRFAAHLDDKRKREQIRSQSPVIQHRKAVYRTIWYHTMSAEDYQRIFVEQRNARKKAHS